MSATIQREKKVIRLSEYMPMERKNDKENLGEFNLIDKDNEFDKLSKTEQKRVVAKDVNEFIMLLSKTKRSKN